MNIRLHIPAVNTQPHTRPDHCPHCGHWHLQRHGNVRKPLKDHRIASVVATRYKCVGCGRTFRHYPEGVTARDQSQRTVVLAALLYGLGLSCSATAHVLGGFGVALCAMTVWRDAQQAGAALRRSRPPGHVQLRGVAMGRVPVGRVPVLGADETVYHVKGKETVVGFVTDGQTGTTLAVDVLDSSDAAAFEQWLAPYVAQYGVEVLVSDGYRSYSVAAAELGLEHQLCLTHVRQAISRRRTAILHQAEQEGLDDGQRAQLVVELTQIQQLVRDLPADGGQVLERLQRRYRTARQPGAGQQASVAYRMRLLTLELWEQWGKLRLYLRRPELGLDGTNNGTERAIGKSKVRYKTMRGYKSLAGLGNGIALTQWLSNGAAQHDLAALLAG